MGLSDKLKHIDIFDDDDEIDEYKFIKPKLINKDEAIAIANNDRTLKTDLNKQSLKYNSRYGLILFNEFKIKLVRVSDRLAWFIKVVSGDWGSTEFIKIPLINKFIIKSYSDGIFTEEDNICCFVLVEGGEYFFVEDEKDYDIKPATMSEYHELVKEVRETQKQIEKDITYNETDEEYQIEW